MTPVPHPPYSPNLALRDTLFVSLDKKKILKGKHFANVEEMKQKNGRSTKGHQDQRVQKLF